MSPASQSFRFRESRRVLREADVRLSVPGVDVDVSAVTRDIATGGMFVSTSEPMPVGTSVHFVLQLGSDDEPAEVVGEATVVWVRPEAGGADQPAGMGVQFSRVEPPGEERLALLFSEEQTEGDVIPAAPVLEAEESEDLDDQAGAALAAVENEIEVESEPVEPGGMVEEDVALEVEPAEIVEAKRTKPTESPPPEAARDALPDIDPPLHARTGDGDDEVEATHADLFGELTQEGEDDWMKPESRSRPWLWPAVGAVVLLVALVVFRGPLLRLVGVGGDPAAEAAPAEAPSFEVTTPGAAAEAPPEGVEDPSTASRPLVPLEEEAAGVESTADDGAAATAATDLTEPAAPEPAAPERSVPPTAVAETRTAPVATPPPARPPSAVLEVPPANATALRSITARTAGDRTVIEIVGNAPFMRHHVMPLEAPPRLLVRLVGVGRDYDASAVRGPRLRGVRTGVHGRGATQNLHVVLDLAAADIAATVERRGDRVVVNLSD